MIQTVKALWAFGKFLRRINDIGYTVGGYVGKNNPVVFILKDDMAFQKLNEEVDEGVAK